DPRDLGAGEVRVDDEAGAFGEERLQAIGLHAVAGLGRAAVLPDDGAMDRAAGLAVPDERGLARVGDADAGELARVDPRRQQGVANGLERGAPEVLRLVLDPARIREMLLELLLADADRTKAVVEHDGAGAGGALVDGEDVALGLHVSLRGKNRSFAASATHGHARRPTDGRRGVLTPRRRTDIHEVPQPAPPGATAGSCNERYRHRSRGHPFDGRCPRNDRPGMPATRIRGARARLGASPSRR